MRTAYEGTDMSVSERYLKKIANPDSIEYRDGKKYVTKKSRKGVYTC